MPLHGEYEPSPDARAREQAALYPDYADYQLKTEREIPVFVLERESGH